MMYVAVGIHLICLVQPDFWQAIFAFISFFIHLHLLLFHLFKMVSQGFAHCRGQNVWILSLPCPLSKPDHMWSAVAWRCPAVLRAAFKHLGVTVLLRVTTAISHCCGSPAASERSIADAQPFYSTSIDADCTCSSVCSAPQLIHPEVFLFSHRAVLAAVT